MTPLPLVLVLLSSVAHATWNLLLKRSYNKEVFVWWLLVSASVLLVPLGVVLYLFHPIPINQPGWWFVLASILLHILYFILLGRGYSHADLSLVYPIARGMGPMLVPILAVAILNETVSPPAIIGILAIIVGIYTVSWWGNSYHLVRQPLEIFRSGAAHFSGLRAGADRFVYGQGQLRRSGA